MVSSTVANHAANSTSRIRQVMPQTSSGTQITAMVSDSGWLVGSVCLGSQGLHRNLVSISQPGVFMYGIWLTISGQATISFAHGGRHRVQAAPADHEGVRRAGRAGGHPALANEVSLYLSLSLSIYIYIYIICSLLLLTSNQGGRRGRPVLRVPWNRYVYKVIVHV